MLLCFVAVGAVVFSTWLAHQIAEAERCRRRTERKENINKRNNDAFKMNQWLLHEIHLYVNASRYRDEIAILRQHEKRILETEDPSQREIYRQKLHNGLEKLLRVSN